MKAIACKHPTVPKKKKNNNNNKYKNKKENERRCVCTVIVRQWQNVCFLGYMFPVS